jgi:hypothetical protein
MESRGIASRHQPHRKAFCAAPSADRKAEKNVTIVGPSHNWLTMAEEIHPSRIHGRPISLSGDRCLMFQK